MKKQNTMNPIQAKVKRNNYLMVLGTLAAVFVGSILPRVFMHGGGRGVGNMAGRGMMVPGLILPIILVAVAAYFMNRRFVRQVGEMMEVNTEIRKEISETSAEDSGKSEE